jgi:phage shock protein A
LRFEDIAGLSDDEIGRTEEDVKVNVVVPWLELLGHTRLKFEHDKNDILIKHGDFIVVVETKKLGVELSNYTDQLEKYVAQRRADLAVLTNGQDFLIFSPFWRKKSFRETLILCMERGNLADPGISTLISNIMSHDSMANGSAKEAIEKREKEIDQAIREVNVELNARRNENVEMEKRVKDLHKEIETLSQNVMENNRAIESLSKGNLSKLSCWYDFTRASNYHLTAQETINNRVSNEDGVLIPNNKVTQDDLVKFILEALHQFGGKARKERVEKYIYGKMQSVFQQQYYTETVSHRIPRWQHNIAWAKEEAKHRGLIKPPNESGRGYWELTDKAKKLVGR